jgi:hypothetical protein
MTNKLKNWLSLLKFKASSPKKKTVIPIQAHTLDKIFSDFLKHPEKKVLILKGNWGVGKTYAWKKYIEANREINESAIAYVSLFGVKDVKEVQQLIVQKA